MENGYKIRWTVHALKELAEAYNYLETNFSERELRNLSREIIKTTQLISQNPHIFPYSKVKGIRRVVIKKYNTMYYREKDNCIEILSFFSNRKNPDKSKTNLK